MSSNGTSTRPRRNPVSVVASKWSGSHSGIARSNDVVIGIDGQTRTLGELTASVTARTASLGIFPR